ncbi:MAG: GGDEF domain-containing protein, partial [Gammaproteobacteria bacterium]|nr:GGDEF domain-containing protein [Gammaproteobacteria bacterium]
MAQTGLTLTDNVRLLKGKASRHAIYGVLIAVTAIALATLLVAQHLYGGLGLEEIVAAQLNNPVLWVLDAFPFIFAFWGQYVSTMIAYQAGAMVIDQTSELQAQAAALEHQAQLRATHDPLTNLPNRILLRDRIEQAIVAAHAGKSSLAILLMGLNRFKEVNNTLGHYSGDRLLKQVATRLQAAVREPDSVARVGGDEFAILLPKAAKPDDVTQAARKLLATLEPPFDLEGLTLNMDAGIGIVLFPQHGADADTLLQRANIAMYVA